MIGSFIVTALSLVLYLVLNSLVVKFAFLATWATVMFWVTIALAVVFGLFVIVNFAAAIKKLLTRKK